jgi:hypothetical protein
VVARVVVIRGELGKEYKSVESEFGRLRDLRSLIVDYWKPSLLVAE